MHKLAVFGNPIAHSLSPLIHQDFARQEGRNIEYSKILVPDDFLSEVQKFFGEPQAVGCNITVPCKLDAYNFVQELTPQAKIAQAVNTIKRTATGFIGDNTDGYGFFTDLKRLNCPLDKSRVLVIGAGGATRGILPSLLSKEANVRKLYVVNRTVDKAQAIVQSMIDLGLASKDNLFALSFTELEEQFQLKKLKCEVVINATSLSLKQELPLINSKLLAQSNFVYDLYYTPEQTTVFTEHCKALGVEKAYDGLGMLVGQAALAYKLWFDFMPDLAQTMNYLRTVLASK